MRIIQITSISLQVLSVCILSYALGYSKDKLPKRTLFLKSVLILNFVLTIFNINRLQ